MRTTGKKDTKGEVRHKWSIAVGLSIAIGLIVLTGYIPLDSFTPSSSEDSPSLSCFQKSDEFDKHVKERWLMNDSIKDIRDLPQKEVKNLSSETRRFIQPGVNPINIIRFQNLSPRQKHAVEKALNNKTVDSVDRNNINETVLDEDPPYNLTFVGDRYLWYQNKTYWCDIAQPPPGA